VAAFNATRGRRLWFAGTLSATVPVTAADGVVYVNEGSDVAMLDSSNGTIINISNELTPPSGSTFSGSVVRADRRLYICSVATSTGVATLRAYQPER
jgi:outer membrane protein assembly factor BamB